MKRTTILALLLFSTTWARSAAADVQARAKLVYETMPGAERCPGEADLRSAVGVRLGYDPFVPEASTEIAVRLEARGRAIVGLLEVRGSRPGQREIASPEGDCREVVDALATAIAIGVDPASLSRPPDAPPPPPAPAPLPLTEPAPVPPASSAPVAEPPPPPPPAESVHPSFGAMGVLAFGELPAAAPGLDLWLGARYRFVSAALEGSFAATSADQGSGSVAASLLGLAVVPCAHYKILFGCAVVRAGALRGEGTSVDLPERASAAYAAVAARAGLQLALAGPLFVRAYAELDVPLSRVVFQLDRKEVWASPNVAARFALGAGLQF